jgi:hypothetical protein
MPKMPALEQQGGSLAVSPPKSIPRMPVKNASQELIYAGKSRDMGPMVVAEAPDLHSKS